LRPDIRKLLVTFHLLPEAFITFNCGDQLLRETEDSRCRSLRCFDKLPEVGRPAANGDFVAIVTLTIEAEEIVLQLERELVDILGGGPRKAA
jgi:hypothetical protein